MKHTFYEDEDFKGEDLENNTLADMVILGGLAICKICKLYEGSLTTECPGQEAYQDYSDDVYAGKIDFINGKWEKTCSPHTPEFYKKEI